MTTKPKKGKVQAVLLCIISIRKYTLHTLNNKYLKNLYLENCSIVLQKDRVRKFRRLKEKVKRFSTKSGLN